MADERDPLLTVRQVADIWGTDVSTIRRYIQKGLVQAEEIGPTKLLRIRLSTVRAHEKTRVITDNP